MNRRDLLALMLSAPFATAMAGPVRPNAKTRVVLGGSHGLRFEPGGTLGRHQPAS